MRIGMLSNITVPIVLTMFIWESVQSARASQEAANDGVAVGPQYDSAHVYVSGAALESFVNAIIGTFGGKASSSVTADVTPARSSTVFRYIWTPVGTFSTFAFQTPVPYPFGQERTGYLVTNLEMAIKAVRAAGADVIVLPFTDPIGRDAIIEWPGGVKMQLYWHFTPPTYPPLETVPENRIYLSADRADIFVRDFVGFSHGRSVSDERQADAGEIGRPGETYRRIRIDSRFGKMQVMVTDGHLPYPYGREIMGYEVKSLPATLSKARESGVQVLTPPFETADRSTAMLAFPGDYIAEVHATKPSH